MELWTKEAEEALQDMTPMTQERMSADQFRKLYGNNSHSRPQLPHSKPQRDHAQPLGQTAQGATEVLGRVRVCCQGHRVRPVDPDNFAASVKNCVDFLRRAGLIDGDEPWKIILETDQVKVSHFYEEKTIVTLVYP